MTHTQDPDHEDACRRCGTIPREWGELTDGLCPECYFNSEVLGDA
jgi:NMD protein affecting ribosome stability and mRNA decay